MKMLRTSCSGVGGNNNDESCLFEGVIRPGSIPKLLADFGHSFDRHRFALLGFVQGRGCQSSLQLFQSFNGQMVIMIREEIIVFFT